VSLCALTTACAASPDDTTPNHATATAAVVDGTQSPDDLNFPIDRFQRNAAVGQVAMSSQGCSGTVVGDRVVVSAAHCVVMNQSAWVSGAAPQVASPQILTYVVGDDVDNPLCVLQAESVQIHPQAAVDASTGAIRHDISVTILDSSVIDNCPAVVPVQINRDPITTEMVNEWVLQGGFGALDYTYNFSPIRYWSLQQLVAVAPDYVVFRSDQHGGPSFGDSGSGFFRRFPDGSLRTLGMDSLSGGLLGTFVRIDAQGSFLDQVVTPDLVCGAVGPEGVCRDHAAVACGPNGFTSNDCLASGQDCAVDGQGHAACVCACDTTSACDTGCACDAACADAGAEAGTDGGTDAAPDGPVPTCNTVDDLLNPDSCGPGMSCDIVDFVAGKAGCRPEGTVEAYDECSVSTPPCVAGSTCVALTPSNWKCDPFCNANSTNPGCPGPGVCIPMYQVGTSVAGVCMEPDNCDLSSTSSCPSGYGCYLIEDGRFCFPAGNYNSGASCTYLNDCRAGYDCLNGKCTRWCTDPAQCSGATVCDGIGDTTAQPDVGHCIASTADAGTDAAIDGAADAGVEDVAVPDAADDAPPAEAAAPDAAVDAEPDGSASETKSAPDDSGCGCRTAPTRTNPSLAGLGLLLFIGLLRRKG